MHLTVREMSAHYAQKKRYVRGVAEQVEIEGRMVGINLNTSEDFWNLRDRARKVQLWKPVVKGIANQYEKRRRRFDCSELREGKRRRREAKRKLSG